MGKTLALCAGFLLFFGAASYAADEENIVAEGSGEGGKCRRGAYCRQEKCH